MVLHALTRDDVIRAGACADGVYSWAADLPLTAAPVSMLLRLANDGACDWIRLAAGLTGNGDGYGNGDGDGNGYGYGSGNGNGYGDGNGYGYGDGYGDGDGNGSGSGDGDGYDYGNG